MRPIDEELIESLGQAVRSEQLEAVERLLRAGADPNAVARDGRHALASFLWSPEAPVPILQALLAAGADPSRHDTDELAVEAGTTSFHVAAAAGSPAHVGAFLRCGVDVDLLDPHGWTPLHYACYWNNVEVVRALLRGGARADLPARVARKRRPAGVTAAELTRDPDIEELLRRHLFEASRAKAPPPREPPKLVWEESRFWQLLDEARGKKQTVARIAKALERSLETLAGDELVAVHAFVWGYFQALDRRELWAAADVLRGGCSDASFDSFKQWLILQGRDVVRRAALDPESLADLPLREEPQSGALLSLAKRVYLARFHGPLPETDAFPVDESQWPEDRIADHSWDAETTARLFPRLTALEAWKRWR